MATKLSQLATQCLTKLLSSLAQLFSRVSQASHQYHKGDTSVKTDRKNPGFNSSNTSSETTVSTSMIIGTIEWAHHSQQMVWEHQDRSGEAWDIAEGCSLLLMSQLPHQWVLGLQNLSAGELASCPFGPRDIDEQTEISEDIGNTIRCWLHAANFMLQCQSKCIMVYINLLCITELIT